jgi:hypothetical protein
MYTYVANSNLDARPVVNLDTEFGGGSDVLCCGLEIHSDAGGGLAGVRGDLTE